MKICAASLHPRVLSGEIESLAGLSRALTRRGHIVTVVAPFATAELLDRPLVALDDGPHALAASAARMLRALPRIIACARRADVLHLSLPTPAFGWVGDLVQAATPTPVVVGFEGHLVPAAAALRLPRLRRAWKTYVPLWAINNGLLARLSLHRCPAYVVSSEYQRRELMGLGLPECRIHVIPNVIDTNALARPSLPPARETLGLAPDVPVIGYLGHFNDGKGVDVLAEAFAGVASAIPDARLALAWSSQGDAAPIRRLLRDFDSRVAWLGKVQVGTFLRAIDALALPYRSTAGQSAFPTLLLETLHAGCPLVTSDLPLIREVVSLGDTALLSPPNRPLDLGRQLAHLIQDEALRARMIRSQRQVAGRFFAPEVLAERYERLYRSVTGQAHNLERAA